MQYKAGTVNVQHGTNIVRATNYLANFFTNVKVGDSFKVKGENAVYNIVGVGIDIAGISYLTLSVPYEGSTRTNMPYQIMRDRTPNLGLAEINPGDEDWPYWLTTEVIRKLDQANAVPSFETLQGVHVGPTKPTDPAIKFWIDTSGT